MEFPTSISKYLKINESGFLICTGKSLQKFINPNFLNEGTKMLHQIINQLGQNSAKSQGLKQVITTAIKFTGSDHRLYLKVEGNRAIGFLRTGQKKLFYHDSVGKMREIQPTCVLDIYVHEDYQRAGIGKEIFQTFLQCENKRPQKVAYDRPSPKLFGFLKKHYGLSKFIPQNNNFVIFDQYFMSLPQKPQNKLQTQQFKKSSNRLYKYDNKPQQTVQIKQANRTLGTIPSQQVVKPQIPIKKDQKIEDSLSLLQNQINRLHLKTPPVSYTQMKVGPNTQLKESLQTFQLKQNTKIGTLDNSKINQDEKLMKYMNYAPWATTSDGIFRTTSNQYGSHYRKAK